MPGSPGTNSMARWMAFRALSLSPTAVYPVPVLAKQFVAVPATMTFYATDVSRTVLETIRVLEFHPAMFR